MNDINNTTNVDSNEVLNVDNLDTSSINFIFIKPCNQYFFNYSINSATDFRLIEKEKLIELLSKLKCNPNKTNYLLDRHLPFIYDCKNLKIREFQMISAEPTREEINAKFTKEMFENVRKSNNPKSSRWMDAMNSIYDRNRNKIR